MRPFDGRRILLVVSGGIAAYKSAYLLRRLGEAGAVVDVLMTRAAERFVGPVTYEALSGRPVHTDIWERPLAHVELGRDAELAIVAPATADLLAGMAHGRADDLATATLLAAACPILACPAMNGRMWENPATRENVRVLAERGVRLLGPAFGPLAEGEIALGRMEEPARIMAEAGRLLETGSAFAGRRVVVTAGSTRAPVDPVRYVGNRSSGRMGFALAESAWRRGAEVVCVHGPVTVEPPHGPRLVAVETSAGMGEALARELEGSDVLLMAAAVSDFVMAEPRSSKIRKESEGGGELRLRMVRGPDLLGETRELRARQGTFTLGFALEMENGPENALRKLKEKGMDLVALNDAGRPDTGLEAETNRITLIDASGASEELPLLSKREVADLLLDRVEARLNARPVTAG
ncbi:MAG: bifunctional phosphopantothenoylcysteine decarboxylase/phosphopantothenate--cysteine ligase CoaBC [Gemmatimonadota bacterium]